MYYFFSYEKIFNYIKMKKKSLYEKNYNFDHISDIFNVNNVNKPEIQFNHKTNRCANKTTYNFLDWNNKNKTFEEGKINNLNCENSENENLRKNKLMKYNKSSIFIGNNDNSYIVKREKFSNNINPPKFYTNVSPYERKIYEVFGEEYNNDKQYCPNQKKITSFGSFNKEVYVQQNNDDYKNINPKMKKLNFLFNDNINNEKPIERRFKKIKRNYSTGNYDNLEPEKYNYHNLKNNYSRKIEKNKEEKKINEFQKESEISEKEFEIKSGTNNSILKSGTKNSFIKNNTILNNITNTMKETIYLFDTKKNVPFPKGEHRFDLVKDFNKYKLKEKVDDLSERVELFFSLNNVQEPNNFYSFGISIINNKRTGIPTFLGDLKEGTGDNIEFGNSFEVDYFFEREQKVIIQPKINGSETGIQKEFILINLMTNREGKINIDIDDIGNL